MFGNHALSKQNNLDSANSLLKEAMALDPDDFKIICFFTTARLTQFFAELFNLIPGGEFRVLEIHSRKSQSSRTKVSDK